MQEFYAEEVECSNRVKTALLNTKAQLETRLCQDLTEEQRAKLTRCYKDIVACIEEEDKKKFQMDKEFIQRLGFPRFVAMLKQLEL